MKTVGLVLSGGGARGFAHLGVVKALNEFGIKPDIIWEGILSEYWFKELSICSIPNACTPIEGTPNHSIDNTLFLRIFEH